MTKPRRPYGAHTDFRKEMSYLIARSLTEMQQYDAALRAFSAVIEKYPDTKEATESAVIMAAISAALTWPSRFMSPGGTTV